MPDRHLRPKSGAKLVKIYGFTHRRHARLSEIEQFICGLCLTLADKIKMPPLRPQRFESGSGHHTPEQKTVLVFSLRYDTITNHPFFLINIGFGAKVVYGVPIASSFPFSSTIVMSTARP